MQLTKMISTAYKSDASPMVLLIIIAFLILAWLVISNRRAAKRMAATQALIDASPYKALAEGVFDRADRCKKTVQHSERVGAMVHTTRHWTTTKHWTAIYLEDGRSWVFKGHIDAPFPKGAKVRIMEREVDGDVYIMGLDVEEEAYDEGRVSERLDQ